jgi:hypothetical protein
MTTPRPARARNTATSPSYTHTATPHKTHKTTTRVSLTIVSTDGTRHPLRALPGTSLVEALLAADVDADAIALSPEGRGAAEAVVMVPAEVAATLPAHTGDAAAALAELAVEVRPNTRLASSVVLGPAMDGAVLALGKLRPWRTL